MTDKDYNDGKWNASQTLKGGYGVGENKNIKLKLARIQKNLSQEQLAEVVGVTRQTIGLIEAGNYNPTIKLCIAICKALDTSLNDIFGRISCERAKD